MRRIIFLLVAVHLTINIPAQEMSSGGTRLIRHKEPDKQTEGVAYLPENEMEAIENHIEKYVGPISNVLHEIVSETVHIDICIVNPTKDNNFYTIFTMGMSALPMNAPKPEFQYSELFICLPPDWKLSENDLKDENNYWPIRLLKTLAKLPHEYNDWLFYGHSMPNGDPAEPFASNTKLSNVIILEPFVINDSIINLEVNRKIIYFFPLFPLYDKEMSYKLETDSDKLIALLRKNKVTEILNISRKPILK